MSMSQHNPGSKTGHFAGLIVFFLGVALLAFTFYNGLIFLLYPEKLAAFSNLILPPEVKDQYEGLFSGLYMIAARIVSYLIPALLLMVLGYIASKITMHGIEMYRTRPPTRVEIIREEKKPEVEGRQTKG